MTVQSFEKTLKALRARTPFRPFRVRFVSGEHIDVEHPEALMYRAGTAVYFDKAGIPTLFDHEGVSEVIGDIESQPKPRRSAS
jgi:hypothetical protein